MLVIDTRHFTSNEHLSRPPSLAAFGALTIGRFSGVDRGNYVVKGEQCAAELYIDRGKDSDSENKAIFDQLLQHKVDIESAFGGTA